MTIPNDRSAPPSDRPLSERSRSIAARFVKYPHLVHVSTEGMVVVDDNTFVHYANPAAARLLGKSEEAIIGFPFSLPLDGAFPTEVLLPDGSAQGAVIEMNVVAARDGDERATLVTLRDITKRRRTEEALARSEAEFRAMAESITAAILILIGETFVYVNHFLEEISGYDREELLKMHFSDIIHPDDRELDHTLAVVNQQADEAPWRYEARLQTKNNDTRWLELSTTRTVFGGRQAVLGTGVDITNRKLAEEARLKAERRYRVLLDQASDAILYADADGVLTDCNQAALELIGYEKNELRGMPLTTLVPPAHLETRPLRLHELEIGRTLISERPIRRKDGSIVYTEISSKLLDDGTFQGIVRDITDRRLAAEKQRLAATVFENSVEGIVVTDRKGRIVTVNRAFTEITGYTFQEVAGKKPALLKSGRHDEEFYRGMWSSLGEFGRWQGEVWNRRKNGEIYPEWLSISAVRSDDGSVDHYVGMFEDRVRHFAHYDILTDLPNRFLVQDRLNQAIAQARRTKKHAALLFVDLDRFKLINDTMGHDVGDLLLKQVASRLLSCLRESDTVARQGGDEFVLVLNEIARPEDAGTVAQKILESLSEPISLRGVEVRVTTSIGVAVFPYDGDDAALLLRNADAAMYHAKSEGRNNFQFYTESMNASSLERYLLECNLRRALERGEYLVYYQPRLEIETMRIVGLEALLRWNHPDLGIILPDRFIPLLEETGLVGDVGDWVLREACRQGRVWRDAGLPPICISVNLSGRQLKRATLVNDVKRSLEDTGTSPELLDLELTESTAMQDAVGTAATLRELKALGIMLSIDDFGTGYSSLSHLKSFPVDTLKIDRSFVRDVTTNPDDAALAEAIIAMAKALRREIVAEGVETLEQAQALRDRGCLHAQGYYYAPALSAEKCRELLVRQAANLPFVPQRYVDKGRH